MTRRDGVACLALAGCLVAGALLSTAQAAETHYKVSADYVNWTVNRGEMDYVFPDSGGVATVDPESDGGFRVGFEIMKGPATYSIGYTSFEAEDEDQFRGSGHGTLILDDVCSVCQSFTFAAAEYDQEYSQINLGVGYQLRPDSKFGLQFIGGLAFGSIEEEFDVLYADTSAVSGLTDTVEQGTEVDTFSFNIGMVPSYKLHDKVSLFGRLNYSPTMADIDRTFVYREGGTGLSGLTTEFDVELGENEVVHRTDFAVGAAFTPTDWLSIKVGYEFDTWLNYPSFLKVTSESGEETIDRGGDGIAFDGFFLQLGYTF